MVYTAAHGGFNGQPVPLGGGAAIANLLSAAWSRSKPFELKLVSPTILGTTAPSAREIVKFNERQYANFCNAFRAASTHEVLKYDPARTVVLVNDISEGPEFELIARAGFRIVTIYHVDVVAYIASIYLRGRIRPETLTRWWEWLRTSAVRRIAPAILNLIFEQQRASLLWSERVIVPSAGMKEIMLRCYPATPTDRIEVLPWGCPPAFQPDSENVPGAQSRGVSEASGEPQTLENQATDNQAADNQAPDAAALRAEYGIQPDAHVMLCLSRLSPEKGHDFLLKSLLEWERSAGLPERPVWLFICGEPAFMNGQSYARRVRSLAARLKRVRVVFPGYVRGARKRAFFGLAQIYLFPSSHESYGLTLTEALSAGLPVISRDHSGARQILRPEFGVIVAGAGGPARLRFRQEMERLLRDDRLREAMSRSAANWAHARPFSASANRLANLLTSL